MSNEAISGVVMGRRRKNEPVEFFGGPLDGSATQDYSERDMVDGHHVWVEFAVADVTYHTLYELRLTKRSRTTIRAFHHVGPVTDGPAPIA